MPDSQPNLLFIFTDQHRVDTMGCYGSKVCQTPNLDRLAQQSVVFDRAYTVCPLCSPARATVQTGLYPFHHGMTGNIYGTGCSVNELPDVPLLLSRRMQKQGYSLGYTGKWHVGMDGAREIQAGHRDTLMKMYPPKGTLPTDVGYEGDNFQGHGDGGFAFPQFQQYLTDAGLELRWKGKPPGAYPGRFAEIVSPIESTVEHYLTQRAMDMIDRFAQRAQPFFYSLHHWGPHCPYLAPTQYLDLYRNVDLPPWPSFCETGEGKPSIHNFKRRGQPERGNWAIYQEQLRHYYAFTSFIDAQIGRLLEHLKKRGLYDNTVIIFSADHGESLGIHGGLEDKSIFLYEETTRIPLLVKPARANPVGRREARCAVTADLYSTILDYAGAKAGEYPTDGRSLLPLVEGQAASDWPDCAVTEGSGIDPVFFSQRAIRWENWKYVFNCGDLDELYDLAADPCEMRNLAAGAHSPPELQQMRRRLATWMEPHRDPLLRAFVKLR